jgi:hypothetical protein
LKAWRITAPLETNSVRLLDWPAESPAERGDFRVVLYALEMARYQHGGESNYLDRSPFK